MINRLLWLTLAVWPARAGQPEALDVLRQSLDAPDAPYSAELEVERREGPHGDARRLRMKTRFSPPGSYRREFLDASGKAVRLLVQDGKTEWIYDPAKRKAWQGEPCDPLYKRFGPDEEVDRLDENYDVAISTGGRVAGRPVWLLELRSRRGSALARRLWVDRENFLVLRSEAYRSDGSLAEALRVTKLGLGKAQDSGLFRFSPPAGTVVVRREEPDYLALDEAKSSGVEPRLPSWLPSGFVFESLDVMRRGRGHVIHYRFSDGVQVVSLFQCPPRVRLGLGKRRHERVKLATGKGTLARAAEGNVLSWSAAGWRFILVGSLAEKTLERMAESVK
ncbi:MAG TPA: hypothetical protein DEB40_05630 [Elusimicrobia bacterium]|nr:hypothetical protein [Elusimicrobiota bacterium]HBT61205.1 hypothetical protein [Elusimicrobiota bacterium]